MVEWSASQGALLVFSVVVTAAHYYSAGILCLPFAYRINILWSMAVADVFNR